MSLIIKIDLLSVKVCRDIEVLFIRKNIENEGE